MLEVLDLALSMKSFLLCPEFTEDFLPIPAVQDILAALSDDYHDRNWGR